jgi:AraC family carnitine catabolism transcriptional activator
MKSRPRPGSEDQLTESARTAQNPAGDAIRSTLALMNKCIEDPLDAAQIARRVGLSARQLRRRFQQSTGVALMRAYLMMRLSRAHNLLQQTNLSVTEIAISAGFRSLEHFSRAYRGAFGCAPSTDRHQSIRAPINRPIGGHSGWTT